MKRGLMMRTCRRQLQRLVGGAVVLAACSQSSYAMAADELPSLQAVQAASCSGCHAATTSFSKALPALSQLSASEVENAMLAFKNGSRQATLMNRIARGYTAQEIQEIAVAVTQ